VGVLIHDGIITDALHIKREVSTTEYVVNKMYESSVYVKCYYWLMDNYPEIHEEWEIALWADIFSKHTNEKGSE
jgi:hypothetical protein